MNNLRHYFGFGFISVLGIILTLSAVWVTNLHNQRQINTYTLDLAAQAESLILEKFQLFQYGLRGARGAVVTAGVDSLTREKFVNYSNTRDLDLEFPGANGFGFIKKVSREQESQFVERMRGDGSPNFKIRELNPTRGDRFVIQYIFPEKVNQQAIGLDIGSENNRRSAAIASARENRVYLTAPITLVQANRKAQSGALILLPVFEETHLGSEDAREQVVAGWAYAPLIIDNVLEGMTDVIDQAWFSLSVDNESDPFYSSQRSDHTNTHAVSRSIEVLGQTWVMQIKPNRKYVSGLPLWSMSYVSIIGLVITLLLQFLVNIRNDKDDSTSLKPNISEADLSLHQYLKTPQCNQSFRYVALIFSLLFLVYAASNLNDHKNAVEMALESSSQQALKKIDQAASTYYQDTLFLANAPSIFEALQKPQGEVTTNNHTSELTHVFEAYLRAMPYVHQVRLISQKDGWKEVVKIQRQGDGFKIFEGEDLQSKKDEPYITQTLAAGEGKVYQSEMNLNREWGTIEYPHRPMWRFSTPIMDEDGAPIAIVILNISVSRLLEEATRTTIDELYVYVTNTDRQFVAHPDESVEFSFDYTSGYAWGDQFSPLPTWQAIETPAIQNLDSESGRVWSKHRSFLLQAEPVERELHIYSTYDQLPVFIDITFDLVACLAILMGVGGLGLAANYWFWLARQKQLREAHTLQDEQNRIRETERFKAILESGPDANLIVDESGIIVLVNAKAELLFGYARNQLEGHSLDKVIPKRYQHNHHKHVDKFMSAPTKRVMGEEGRVLFGLRSDGSEFPVDISLSYIDIDDGKLVIASVRSMEERLMIEEQLRIALKQAQQATEAKSAFLANTSHEIRTPLNAVIGLSDILSDQDLTDTQLQLVKKIQISGKSLLGIVNDVLDLSKIEASEMTLEQYPTNIKELIEEIASVFSIQAEDKALGFILEIDPDLPLWLKTDSTRLRQILVNLLGNALKFTQIGSISLAVEVVRGSQDNDGQVMVKFSVTDTGVGIKKESQEHLFIPFNQADSSTTRNYGGTGLGLSIVYNLTKLFGGQVSLTSEVNIGSTFCVELPFTTVSEDEEDAQESKSNFYVVIAEDNPKDAKQLCSMSRSLGWRTQLVESNNSLVELLLSRREQNLRLPDALIVDRYLGKEDCLEAVKRLAKEFESEVFPSVLLVSGSECGDAASEPLVDMFLAKPIDTSELFDALNSIVSKSSSYLLTNETRYDEHSQTKWLPELNVLAVDDVRLNLVVVTHILSKNGANVTCAQSGREAIRLVANQDHAFDLILMDVQMPDIDGLEATQMIRKHQSANELPIIALTAGALLEEKNRALDSGMNDFITKPIEPAKMVSLIRKVMKNAKGQELAIESIEVNPEVNDDWPTIDGLNKTQAQKLLMGDQTLFFNTLELLLSEHRNLMSNDFSDFDNSSDDNVRLTIAAQVHKLRSASGMIGAEQIHKLSSEAETLLRSNQNANQTLSSLSDALHQLKHAASHTLSERKSVSVQVAQEASEPIPIDVLKQIITLLNNKDLEVIEQLELQEASLRTTLLDKDFKALQESMSTLDFQKVSQILNHLLDQQRSD
ncbi:CHASE domain-containing protein [Vibrio sp. ECSMB14106]|uniref:CHASE domain-containing protein n=1 Tax=Vibrio sp. ECSMB14106 TaxID=1638949 RepID=UPI0006986711|nr:CHASE domain-containing protein [Vibrio sp. ECSMB14106]